MRFINLDVDPAVDKQLANDRKSNHFYRKYADNTRVQYYLGHLYNELYFDVPKTLSRRYELSRSRFVSDTGYHRLDPNKYDMALEVYNRHSIDYELSYSPVI